MNRDGWRPYRLTPGCMVIKPGVLMVDGEDGKLVPAPPEMQDAYLDEIAPHLVHDGDADK